MRGDGTTTVRYHAVTINREGDDVAPSGYSISIDQAAINNANKDSLSFTFSGGEVDATYNYTVSSSGGAGSATGSGIITSATQQITGINVSGLPDGPSYPLPDCWPEGQYPLRKEWNPAYFNKQTMAYEPPKEEADQ